MQNLLENPNTVSLPDDSLMLYESGQMVGITKIKDAFEIFNFNHNSDILTSKDLAVKNAQDSLEVSTIPKGFTKHLLPIENKTKDILFFISKAEPFSECPTHKHTIDEGFRVIMKGSIVLNNEIQLEEGDWFYVPVNENYSFTVGEYGATIFHAYSPR